MSSLFDVTGIDINEGQFTSSISSVQTIVADVQSDVTTVTIAVEASPEIVQVAVPGTQGPPGDQMVYPQSNDPAVEYGWGPADAGKIWIVV